MTRPRDKGPRGTGSLAGLVARVSRDASQDPVAPDVLDLPRACPRHPACFAQEMDPERQRAIDAGFAAAQAGDLSLVIHTGEITSPWVEGYLRGRRQMQCRQSQRCAIGAL